MSFKDRIGKFVKINEGDYYDDIDNAEFDEYEDEEDFEQDIPVTKKSAFSAGFRQPEKSKSNVVDFDAQSQQKVKPQVVLAKPATHEDSKDIADHINQRHMVILNLEATSKETARRIYDFITGVAYANRGNVRKIANSTFVIVPYGYDFGGELLDSIENEGIYFG